MRRTPLKRGPLKRGTLAKRSKKPSQKNLKAKADKAAGDWFRAGECACKGYKGHICAGRIEWAHLKSRGILCVRHSPFNALPLCWKAHQYYTMHPDAWVKFVESRFPGRWDYLNERIAEAMQNHEKPNYLYWLEWYLGRTDDWSEWSALGGAA